MMFDHARSAKACGPSPRSRPRSILFDHRHYLELLHERDQWRRMSESGGRGFVVLDGASHVHWVGRRARHLLSESGLPVALGRLPKALEQWLEPVIHGQVAAVAPLRRGTGDRSLVIAYHPHVDRGSGAMLSVEPQGSSHGGASLDVEQSTPIVADTLGLTRRQAEVALWMSQGKSNRDIAVILAIRPATVKKHAERIFAALGVENRTSAASVIHQALADASATAA